MFFMPPMSLGLTRYSRAGGSGIPFDPSILFSNGEQGSWWDPSDLTTLFQDAAGTIPVTADGDPVGLMLDKRAWGGKTLAQVLASQPELADGALFDKRPGTNGTVTRSDGVINFVAAGSGISSGISQSIAGLTIGSLYLFRARIRLVAGTNYIGIELRTGSGGGGSSLSGLSKTTVSSTFVDVQIAWFATDISAHLTIAARNQTIEAVEDYISFKEIPGNHSTQAATAAKPAYRSVGGVRYLKSDGVDDALNVSFPAGSYTRAYVTAAGGMTIDEGVAISGPENIMQASAIAGILYIDRALTGDEMAKLAAYWGATL